MTFFTVGRHGDPEDPDVQRFIITEEGFEANVISPRFPVLDAANDETVTLSLRGSGLTVADLKWISVWCFDFKVNFGDLEFDSDPDNLLEIEKEINLFSEEEPEESFEFDSAQDLISEEQEQDYEDFNNDYEDNTIEKVGEVDTHSNSDPEPEAEILILPEPEDDASRYRRSSDSLAEPAPEADDDYS